MSRNRANRLWQRRSKAAVMRAMSDGYTEKSIIRSDLYKCSTSNKHNFHGDMRVGDRSCNVMQSVEFGQSEKSIIKQPRDHYATIHPTQKPVRLLERLLALVTKEGDIILDPFAGSASIGHCLHGYGEGFHRIRDRPRSIMSERWVEFRNTNRN